MTEANARIDQLRDDVDSLTADNSRLECRAVEAENALKRFRESIPDSDELARRVHDYMRDEGIIVGTLDAPLLIASSEYRSGLLKLCEEALGEE